MASQIFQVITCGKVGIRVGSIMGNALQTDDGKQVRLGTGYQFEADPTNAETDDHGWIWLEHDRGWSPWRTTDNSQVFIEPVETDSIRQALSFLQYGNPDGNSEAARFFNAYILNAKAYLAEIQKNRNFPSRN